MVGRQRARIVKALRIVVTRSGEEPGVIAGGVASVQTGAGIVYDSVPEREWEETENKARALLTAIGRVRGDASGR